MYGDAVHKAVISAGESESGITIHYVNKDYDKGEVIFQARCKIQENDTAEVLAERIHNLEYQHYPKVIEAILTDVPYPTKTG
jgi:phosphoribosylglycinamide formyltransferase-1